MNPMDAQLISSEFKDYAYSVSHDLSAPVRAMVAFSKLLTEEHAQSLSEEAREYLAIVIENGDRLQSMMDGLLQYSRLNTMSKPFTSLDCNRILENCAVVMQQRLHETCAQLAFSGLPTISGDFDQITDLFLHLIDNAVKFQPSGHKPFISIASQTADDCWQFAVSDNGIGIEPQFHNRIFKLFQRLHTEDEYPGIGVGLTLAQKIVHRHGGSLWCESAPGAGTCFYFTIQRPQRS